LDVGSLSAALGPLVITGTVVHERLTSQEVVQPVSKYFSFVSLIVERVQIGSAIHLGYQLHSAAGFHCSLFPTYGTLVRWPFTAHLSYQLDWKIT
jgi:hypothetical protein